MTFSWFCQGLLLPLQHHLKVVPFSNIFWGIFTLLSTKFNTNFSGLGEDKTITERCVQAVRIPLLATKDG